MHTFVVLRTHTNNCRQRLFRFAVKATDVEEAKFKLQDAQDEINSRGWYVEQDAIVSMINGDTSAVTDYPSPLVVLGSR